MRRDRWWDTAVALWLFVLLSVSATIAYIVVHAERVQP